MFSKVLVCCLFAYVAAGVAEEYPPQPYHFSYDNTDEYGTRNFQEETGDANNGKVGTYGYTDAAGNSRTVKYVADAGGFRATVETNEPGTKTSEPAGAQYISSAVEDAGPVAVKAAPVTVHAVQAAPVVHTVHAAPVVHAVHASPVAVHAAPFSFALSHAPLSYTLGRAKSA